MNNLGLYRTTFSNLAKFTSAQASFFESLMTFMKANNFDGVDIDISWCGRSWRHTEGL
ncbi:glycoside hydrolase family 18 protein [Cucurbitaria berberidis CBS 394.84]|uniref:Glycoside hydrolase family 18 protein n=1 Tax=Cucurbitaria berberidis CBS 394.84 TaxID=1168544 RepID=A0A9P4GN01_9PLEO|nr:glycoside hydrolase family 18 protein [Cucurbitaria berberidis CBS 394.84]KAF1848021.1 glycoside hydrolase family 18 protein [Cucurbitaria berberidis CBS 394.84]